MSKRTATWLAWSMCALSLVLTALSLFLLTLNLSHPGVHIFDYWLLNVLLTIGFSAVSAVTVSRSSPSNLIGWLFCAIGVLWGVVHLAAQYTIYTLLAALDHFLLVRR